LKTQKCFTLSPEVQRFLEEWAKNTGTSQSTAVELILREKAKNEGVDLKAAEENKS
jgi:hypothetical protein